MEKGLKLFLLGGALATAACLITAWQPIAATVGRIGHLTIFVLAFYAAGWAADQLLDLWIRVFHLYADFFAFVWDRQQKKRRRGAFVDQQKQPRGVSVDEVHDDD
jgi:hypothetical protein